MYLNICDILLDSKFFQITFKKQNVFKLCCNLKTMISEIDIGKSVVWFFRFGSIQK